MRYPKHLIAKQVANIKFGGRQRNNSRKLSPKQLSFFRKNYSMVKRTALLFPFHELNKHRIKELTTCLPSPHHQPLSL